MGIVNFAWFALGFVAGVVSLMVIACIYADKKKGD